MVLVYSYLRALVDASIDDCILDKSMTSWSSSLRVCCDLFAGRKVMALNFIHTKLMDSSSEYLFLHNPYNSDMY